MSPADAGIAWLTGQASARAELIDSLDDPLWDESDQHTELPLMVDSTKSKPLKKITRPEEKLI